MRRALAALLVACLLSGQATHAQDEARAMYLANQGVLVTAGDTGILFDPLFDADFGQFQLVPAELHAAMLAGEPPFDGVAAVFVSHAHGDHFSAEMMLEYLRRQPSVRLYAPVQATRMLRQMAYEDADVLSRVTGIALEHGDEPFTTRVGNLDIGAVRLPHSGWPDRMTDIENLAFRVALNGNVVVEHYGDADPTLTHFEANTSHWESTNPAVALPPYWFFLSPEGRQIVDEYIRPAQAIGTHAPVELPPYPATRTPEFQAYDLFRVPGETRTIP